MANVVTASCRREILRFYFDLMRDYEGMYPFLPHSAIALYDLHVDAHPLRPLAAACFTVANKMYDIAVVPLKDLAELFACEEVAITHVEFVIFKHMSEGTGSTMCDLPERTFFEHARRESLSVSDIATRFFHISCFEPQFALVDRARASFAAAALFEAGPDGQASEGDECTRSLLWLARHELGAAFAPFATTPL